MGNRSPLHFSSMQHYHNYLATIHIHGYTKHHHHPVYINGKLHHVCHTCGSVHHRIHPHPQRRSVRRSPTRKPGYGFTIKYPKMY